MFMIEAENLGKFYGSQRAIEQLNFSIAKGEVVGFLGPNGAGKSTTMNILTGFLALSEGSVRIDGWDIFAEARRARQCIGYLPEQPPLYPELTVREYLRHICGLKKLGRRKTWNLELERVLTSCSLNKVVGRKIANLSKGFRQRVGLAQALLGQPPLLILDEPTVGLDPQQVQDIRSLIQQLSSEHTVLFSSHILSEIEAVCQRVLILHRGRLVADGSSEKLGRELNSQSCRLRLEVLAARNSAAAPNTAAALLAEILASQGIVEFSYSSRALAAECLFALEFNLAGDEFQTRRQLSQALSAKGFTIVTMQPQRRSLEDIFLNLTASSRENSLGEINLEETGETINAVTTAVDGKL